LKLRSLDLSRLPVYEADADKRACISLLPQARAILAANRTRAVIVPRAGLARLLNLVHWDVATHLEYLDERAVYADQLCHFAAHQLIDALLGSRDPYALLFAEAFASALDFYLLGKLIQAGEETGFLIETIESFTTYYELYDSEDQLELVLTRTGEAPFTLMAEVADYLFQCAILLMSKADPGEIMQALGWLAEGPLYPLVHHYNVSNWVLAIRVRCPAPGPDTPDMMRMRKLFLQDESTFLAHFRLPSQ